MASPTVLTRSKQKNKGDRVRTIKSVEEMTKKSDEKQQEPKLVTPSRIVSTYAQKYIEQYRISNPRISEKIKSDSEKEQKKNQITMLSRIVSTRARKKEQDRVSNPRSAE